MDKPVLIAMVGLPRSGKSTLSTTFSKAIGAPIVRRDAIRLALHGQRYATDAEPMVKAMSLYMIKALFEAGHDRVIYDETCYSRAHRDSIKSDKWDTVFWEVPTIPEVCKYRAVVTYQTDLIPVIDEMAKRFEPLGDDEVRISPSYLKDNGIE